MIGFDTFRCKWDTDRIWIITYSCLALRITALFSSAELFWYFSKFGRGWKWPCGKLRIRYELLRTLRMWYVLLRNERIVADGLYVPSAGSVSVCVCDWGIKVTTKYISLGVVKNQFFYECVARMKMLIFLLHEKNVFGIYQKSKWSFYFILNGK